MRKAFVTTGGRTVKNACPGCGKLIDAVTGVALDKPPRNLKLADVPTICAYCGTLLIFKDNTGHLRLMTEAERNSIRLDPILMEIQRKFQQKAAEDAVKNQKATRN